MKNYYDKLCTIAYELNFYLSYAKKKQKILEIMCGTGRFLIPFINRGYDITGLDLSKEMLIEFKKKNKDAKIILVDILNYHSDILYDYIFITSGSIGLFTDLNILKDVLLNIKKMLKPNGIFLFAIDSIANKENDNNEYQIAQSLITKEGYKLIYKNKKHYEIKTQTMSYPSIYELIINDKIVQREYMDFEIHLYKFQEMNRYLKETGFSKFYSYSSFNKDPAKDDNNLIYLYECHN